MSVREYSFEEIEAIYAAIQGLRPRLLITAKSGQLQRALRAAYYANKAALACTYNEDTKMNGCHLPDGCKPDADKKEVFMNVGLLLYNCVSNGGRDFMPEQDRAILENVRLEIAWHVMEDMKAEEVRR